MELFSAFFDKLMLYIDIPYCIGILLVSFLFFKNFPNFGKDKLRKAHITLIIALVIGALKCYIEVIFLDEVDIDAEYLWQQVISFSIATSFYELFVKKLIDKLGSKADANTP